MEVLLLILKIEIELSEKYNNPQTVLFRRITATHQCGLDEFVNYWGGPRTQDSRTLDKHTTQ